MFLDAATGMDDNKGWCFVGCVGRVEEEAGEGDGALLDGDCGHGVNAKIM